MSHAINQGPSQIINHPFIILHKICIYTSKKYVANEQMTNKMNKFEKFVKLFETRKRLCSFTRIAHLKFNVFFLNEASTTFQIF